MVLSSEKIKEYLVGTKRHAGYDKSVELYEELRVHAEGEYPKEAISERRPSELPESKKYREKISVPLAKETFNQIVNCISKIRRSSDWMIKFDADAAESLPENETPEYYLTKNYPHYTSYEQWLFSALLKNYLMDAGAKILVKPVKLEVERNEYLEPYPFIFNSKYVYEYDELNQVAVFGYEQKQGERKKITLANEWSITTYQLNQDGGWDIIEDYLHGLRVMPVVKMRSVFFKEIDGVTVNESRIQTIAPRLKEFAREYSDLQAEVVQHIHSERWQWATQHCQKCSKNGISSGKLITKKGGKESSSVCPDCKGTGEVSASPFTTMVIRPSKKNMGEQDAPIPPAGYITKQTEIVKIQDERCDKHIYKALASLNMQFLMSVPLNQSGYAKDVDREELQNFVYHCGEDLIGISDDILFLTTEYRYRVGVTSEEKRKALLPQIPVPEKFDLLSANYLIDEITKAATAKINPIVVMQMQVELVNKKYYYDQDQKDFLEHILTLDPLTGLTEEEKMVRMNNAPESFMVNYLVSINIYTYLQQAVEADKEFYGKKYSQKMKVLRGFAEKELRESEPKKVEVDPSLTDPNLPPNGKPQPALNE